MNVLFFLLSAVAWAASTDPIYPPSTVKGHYANGFKGFAPFVLEPGSLVSCASAAGSLVSQLCQLSKAGAMVEIGGKTFPLTLSRVTVSYIGGTATASDTTAYFFQGTYDALLPDKSLHESPAHLLLIRKTSDPGRLQGQLSIAFLGANSGVVASWPSP